MKKVNFTGKLSLSKDIITKFEINQLNAIKGGGSLNHISCGGHICGGGGTVNRCPIPVETFDITCNPHG
jgi:hypothetical protein